MRAIVSQATVDSIADNELVRRAVCNALDRHKRKGEKHPRWVAVMDTFALGATFAYQLCCRYGLDPDEQVAR